MPFRKDKVKYFRMTEQNKYSEELKQVFAKMSEKTINRYGRSNLKEAMIALLQDTNRYSKNHVTVREASYKFNIPKPVLYRNLYKFRKIASEKEKKIKDFSSEHTDLVQKK